MVEHQFFVLFYKALNPKFELIKRVALRNDCMKMFAIEKQKLRSMLRNVDRISLTTDLWTSNQTIGYICITGHFLDSEWKLQKRILNFCSLAPPHTGIAIADCILQCLTEWEIEDKVSTITLDNASSNDTAVKVLRDNFAIKGKLYFSGKIFHVRCCAHVLNLMVQDGLAEIRDVIENIRESVKYLKMSPSRLHKFTEIVKQLKLSTSKILQLDVPTRWNSTYEMLESALEFKPVFPMYKERDSNYKWLPSEEDWIRATEVSKFLKIFNEVTEVFSRRQYPTSNLFLNEIWRVKEKLNDMSFDTRDFVVRMTRRMNEKFEKYWGDCNLLMAIGAVLDPRCKMQLIVFCFPQIYGEDVFQRHIDDVHEALDMLYKEYVSSDGQIDVDASNIPSISSKLKNKRRANHRFHMWSQQHRNAIPSNKTELDMYLEEDIFKPSDEDYDKFDALNWWKANTLKYRYLSKMARDILSIPITTVASEAAFSAGGRVLDQYRSSLKPETVQALICTGDWLRQELGLEQSSNVDEEFTQWNTETGLNEST
ncbi:zinc finger BED domain-containing protein RICESLEEPER 2-like [Phoenix dactylifera]|uniref:Zinc finger BED domain-containing protein RICESLEEPER 2-like n=1 Tax=Phoenix dactylifera TaxID=42345 RepID=A0A8B9AW35_PHODC|nr:zinc finger BED domain-containing protein RICESLEEPER 2-like [Phoenix dactylifera]